MADVLRAGVAGGKGPQKWVAEDGKAGWNRWGGVEQADGLSTPGHVLPGFTLASELLAEVEELLPRAAEC